MKTEGEVSREEILRRNSEEDKRRFKDRDSLQIDEYPSSYSCVHPRCLVSLRQQWYCRSVDAGADADFVPIVHVDLAAPEPVFAVAAAAVPAAATAAMADDDHEGLKTTPSNVPPSSPNPQNSVLVLSRRNFHYFQSLLDGRSNHSKSRHVAGWIEEDDEGADDDDDNCEAWVWDHPYYLIPHYRCWRV